tara:strand:+ start:781 stop:978 length:198 start_codon:yes stop_codon:yes gene_type:complete
MPRDEQSKLLDTRETSMFLWGNSKRSNFFRLYRMRDAGALNPIQIGKKWFFKRQELEGLTGNDAN